MEGEIEDNPRKTIAIRRDKKIWLDNTKAPGQML
jgi:hypothetical protein